MPGFNSKFRRFGKRCARRRKAAPFSAIMRGPLECPGEDWRFKCGHQPLRCRSTPFTGIGRTVGRRSFRSGRGRRAFGPYRFHLDRRQERAAARSGPSEEAGRMMLPVHQIRKIEPNARRWPMCRRAGYNDHDYSGNRAGTAHPRRHRRHGAAWPYTCDGEQDARAVRHVLLAELRSGRALHVPTMMRIEIDKVGRVIGTEEHYDSRVTDRVA